MLKLVVTMLAVALAGSAGAAGWRSLRVDASSEAAFEESLAEFKQELSPARRYVFGEALKDIWVAGTQAAEAQQSEYAAADYYRQLDGLTYDEVVRFTDPTGDTAKARYRQASLSPAPHSRSPFPALTDHGGLATSPAWHREAFPRGGTPLHGPTLPQP